MSLVAKLARFLCLSHSVSMSFVLFCLCIPLSFSFFAILKEWLSQKLFCHYLLTPPPECNVYIFSMQSWCSWCYCWIYMNPHVVYMLSCKSIQVIFSFKSSHSCKSLLYATLRWSEMKWHLYGAGSTLSVFTSNMSRTA